MKFRNSKCSPLRGVLRVLIYARYSTEEQSPSSITDQLAFCKKFLESLGITNVEIEILSDAEMSGELVSRPGITRVLEGVRNRKWNLILVEDSSRLFRHETACGELIETAVDNGIRVIAINDGVDTAEEDWEDPLHEATRHHARSNRYTAKRIKRRLTGLWTTGAAIGLLKPGYKRKPSSLATQNEPEQGPFYDELDPTWVPIVREAFERIANGEPCWRVGEWLTAVGLPKCGNATSKEWTDRNVLALVRRTVYRGQESYRDTIVRKEYRTGKHKAVRNDRDEVLYRDMPHLRIVSDWLWYAANEAIKSRTLRKPGPVGLDHPLAGIPRDSRGPLSELFFCGICEGKMYREGRAKGGYRCSQAPLGKCWNKATALCSIAHASVSKAIVDLFTTAKGTVAVLVNQVGRVLEDDGPMKKKQAELRAKRSELMVACDRLIDSIEKAKEPPELLVERLRDRQDTLAKVDADLDRLATQKAGAVSLPLPEEIAGRITDYSAKLLDMDREAGALLRRFVPRILAVPCQQFGSNKVVLRARLEVCLARLLPVEVSAYFQDGSIPVANLEPKQLLVDLFEPSAGPKHFAMALQLRQSNMSLMSIAQELGIAKRQAHIAVQYGKEMQVAGQTDPFLELKEAPLAGSRWGPRGKKAQNG